MARHDPSVEAWRSCGLHGYQSTPRNLCVMPQKAHRFVIGRAGGASAWCDPAAATATAGASFLALDQTQNTEDSIDEEKTGTL